MRFSAFDGRAAVDAAYEKTVRQAGIERGTSDCTATTGAEHGYPGVGTPTGRVLCYSRGGAASLVWTNDEARTIAHMDGRASDDNDLARSWSSWVDLPPFPAKQERVLLKLVELERGDCRRAPPGSLDELRDVTAGIECASTDEGATTISYYSFADEEGLRRSYDSDVSRVDAPSNVYCGDGDAPGFLGTSSYNPRSVEFGGLLCHPGPHDQFVIEWSVESLLVLGRATGDDAGALADWWQSYGGPPNAAIVEAVNAQAKPRFPTPDERELLGHVPAAFRASCMRPPQKQLARNVGDPEVTAVACGPARGAGEIFYYKFEDRAAMYDSYYFAVGETSKQDCTTNPPNFVGDAPYSIGGEPVGRLLCGKDTSDSPYIEWTNDRLLIQGLAFNTEKPAILLD